VPQYRFDLSEACAKVIPPPDTPPPHDGPPPRSTPDPVAAEERLRKAADVPAKLVAGHPYIPQYLASQAHLHHRFGGFLRRADRPKEAEQRYRKAVTLQSSLYAGQMEQFVGPHARAQVARPLPRRVLPDWPNGQRREPPPGSPMARRVSQTERGENPTRVQMSLRTARRDSRRAYPEPGRRDGGVAPAPLQRR